MKKEDIPKISEILSSMKTKVLQLEEAQKNKNTSSEDFTKKELLGLQANLDKLL